MPIKASNICKQLIAQERGIFLLMDNSEFLERTENIKSKLYRTAYLYLSSESLALDAVDEAIYKALKSLKKLRQPQFFETWLTRILINECKKELLHRKRFVHKEVILEEDQAPMDSLPLKEAIQHLPLNLREIVILRYFSRYTLAETAESLSIPQGTVVTWQRRALKLLKLELEEED